MDAALIHNWNKSVRPNDQIYHLGDLSMNAGSAHLDAILSQLNGRKYLVTGNHDAEVSRSVLEKHFLEVSTSLTRSFFVNKRQVKIIMSHYPMRSWNESFHGSLHFFGHVHGRLDNDTLLPNAVDVGVDSWNYAPVSLQTLVDLTEKRSQQASFFRDGMLGM